MVVKYVRHQVGIMQFKITKLVSASWKKDTRKRKSMDEHKCAVVHNHINSTPSRGKSISDQSHSKSTERMSHSRFDQHKI